MSSLLFFGGDIVTWDEGPQPEALLVKDGVIAACGRRDELALACPDAQPYPLDGHALLPAFIDAHSHLTSYAQTLRLAQLHEARCFDDVVRLLEQHRKAAGLKKGQWLLGFGYDQNSLREGRHPDRSVLDRVGGGHPVLITHASGHMGVMNTAALQAAGLNSSVSDPQGGRYGREADGSLNGYLEENAMAAARESVPAASDEENKELVARAQRIYASHGVATVQEGLAKAPEMGLLRACADSGALMLDVVAYADIKDNRELAAENAGLRAGYHSHLRLGGYKLFLDGSPQGRTAWMTKPYAGDKSGYCGYPIYHDDEVRRFVRQSVQDGMQLLCHCNGDAAAEQYLSAWEAELAGQSTPLRPVMIHAQLVQRQQLPRMAKIGMIPSFFVAHTWHWGDVHLENFGPERADFISPAHSAQKAGLPFTFHQDCPVLPPDMLDTLWCATHRRTRNGRLLAQDECVDIRHALYAVTRYAALQYFEESRKGSIAPGMAADLTVLSQNPLTAPPDALRDIQVCETFKAGNSVWRA